MINASNEGICFEFEEKNSTTLIYLLSNMAASTNTLLRLTR